MSRLALAGLLVSLCCWQVARADALAPVTVVAVKSIDSAAALVADVGVPVPVSADKIEETFPFIGKGNVATDKPIGIVFFVGSDPDPSKNLAFVIPVKDGAATVETLLKSPEAKPMEGHADTVLFGTAALRRTKDYLIFSPTAAIPALVEERSLADALKGPDSLAHIVVNLKAIRQNAPDLLKKFGEMAKAGTPAAKSDPERQGQEMALGWMQSAMDNLDHLDIGLDRGAFGVRLSVTAAPIKGPAAIIGERPRMPAGVIGRLDLSGAAIAEIDSESIHETIAKAALQGADEERIKSGHPLTEDQKRSLRSIFDEVTKLSLADDGVSIGAEFLGKSPVVYVLERYSKPADFSARLRKVLGKVNSFSDELKEDRPALELQTYPLNDMKVVRLIIETSPTDKTPVGYIDAVEKGNDVLIAISEKPFRSIDRLIDAQAAAGADISGKSADALAAGWIDLGRLFDAVVGSENSPLASLSADQRAQARKLLSGVRVETSTSVRNDTGSIEITVPSKLIQDAPKLIGLFGGGGESPQHVEPASSK